MSTQTLLYLVPLCGVAGLLFTFWKSSWVAAQDPGDAKMRKIAGHIAEGAMAFLKAEYKILAVFVACVAVLLAVTSPAETSSPSPLWLVPFVPVWPAL